MILEFCPKCKIKMKRWGGTIIGQFCNSCDIYYIKSDYKTSGTWTTHYLDYSYQTFYGNSLNECWRKYKLKVFL